MESWYTNLQQTPRNRCQQLPVPYKRLIHDEQQQQRYFIIFQLILNPLAPQLAVLIEAN